MVLPIIGYHCHIDRCVWRDWMGKTATNPSGRMAYLKNYVEERLSIETPQERRNYVKVSMRACGGGSSFAMYLLVR